MKKLFSLVSLMVLLGFGVNVMGQNSGTAIRPSVGDIFTYSVAEHASSTYAWTLEANALGGGTNLFGATLATATGADSKDVTITWVNPATDGTKYYLHVVETNNGCSNRKVIAIQPKNNFTIDIVNVNASGTPLTAGEATDYSVCAPAIPNTIVWNGTGDVDDLTEATNFKYDYGTTVFYYKVTAAGINFTNTTWTPSISIAQLNAANATVSVATQIGGTFGSSWETASPILAVGSTSTPTIPAGSGNNVIWVRVTVANGFDTPSVAEENVTDSDFTITLNAASKDQRDNPAAFPVNTSTVQTQSARPNTGSITTN